MSISLTRPPTSDAVVAVALADADDGVGGLEAAGAAGLGVVQVGVEAHGVGDHGGVELGDA